MRKTFEISDSLNEHFKKVCILRNETEGVVLKRFIGQYIDSYQKGSTPTQRTTELRDFLEKEIQPGSSITESSAFNLLDGEFGITHRKFTEVKAEIQLSSRWDVRRVALGSMWETRFFRK